MGGSGSKKENPEKKESESPKEEKKENHQTTINEKFKIQEGFVISNKNDRVEEVLTQASSSFENVDRLISNISKSICKIKIEINNDTVIGTGFLLKFIIDQERFYCLISNEHVLKENLIQNKHTIYMSYDNEFKGIRIQLDENERYIKAFKYMNLDITVVEIIDEDNVSKDYFLLPEIKERINEDIISNQIYYIIYLNILKDKI